VGGGILRAEHQEGGSQGSAPSTQSRALRAQRLEAAEGPEGTKRFLPLFSTWEQPNDTFTGAIRHFKVSNVLPLLRFPV